MYLVQNQPGQQPLRWRFFVGIIPIAAPGIDHKPVNKSSPYRVAMDITRKPQKIGVVFNNDAFIAALKQMTAGVVMHMEPARMGRSKPLHGFF